MNAPMTSQWPGAQRVGWAFLLCAATMAPAHSQMASSANAQTVQARSLAATCANCHGTDGRARGDMLSLAGMPSAQLVATMDKFRSGQQTATVMHQISKGYTPEQIKLMADYFAAQKAKP